MIEIIKSEKGHEIRIDGSSYACILSTEGATDTSTAAFVR